MPKNTFKQKTIALVYDFDSTLTPLAMQEYTVLPELGIDANDFWAEAASETRRLGADPMLTWMRLMLEKIEAKQQHLGRKELSQLASRIKYYQGVPDWFSRIDSYIAEKAPKYLRVNHYLISAGLKEIIEGCAIRKNFKRVYASEYFFNHHGRATFPAVLVNDTMKTQFLFRINKGKEKLSESINEHMPEEQRPIPFENMVYIGDGLSDVPSMTVTKKNGGFAVAVHQPKHQQSIGVCRELLNANRVDYYAEADFREGKKLDRYVKNTLDIMIANIRHNYEVNGLRNTGQKKRNLNNLA